MEFHTENTIRAFRSAGDAGVTEWELDVRFDRLGTPVVLHDAKVDRVSPATGAIASLDATTRQIPINDGQYIPRLHEVLQQARAFGTHVLVELKVRPTAAQWEAVVEAIDETVGRAGVTVISFDRETVLEAREKVLGAQTGLIHQAGYLSSEQILAYGGSYIKQYQAYSESRASEWSAAGIRLYAWTVNDQKDWSRLITLPIDVMVTDRPTAYLAWVGNGCPDE